MASETSIINILRKVASGELTPEAAHSRIIGVAATSVSEGNTALASGSVSLAQARFEAAIEVATAETNDVLRAQALFGLGKTLNASDNRSGTPFICDAFDLFVENRFPERAVEVARHQGGFPYNRRILDMVTRAEDLTVQGSPEWVELISRRAVMEMVLHGDVVEAEKLMQLAMSHSSSGRDVRAQALVFQRNATLTFGVLRFGESMENSVVAVSNALASEDIELLCTTSQMASRTALVLGDLDAAEHYTEIYLSAARRWARPFNLFEAQYLNAERLVARGNWADAGIALSGIDRVQGLDEQYRMVTSALRALVLAETGNNDEASRTLSGIARSVIQKGERPNVDLSLMLRGHAARMDLLPIDTIERLGLRNRAWLDAGLPAAVHNTALLAEYIVAFQYERHETAETLLGRELETSRDGIVTAGRMWCSNHYRGYGLAAAERWIDAANEFEEALRVYSRAGMQPPGVWCAVDYAEMSVRSGRKTIKDRAMTELLRSEKAAAELGMKKAQVAIAGIRRSLGVRNRDESGLTAREAEVLRCIAIGMSNTEIASELTISENTVRSHIKSIYSRLGVGTRAEATAYSLRLPQTPE